MFGKLNNISLTTKIVILMLIAIIDFVFLIFSLYYADNLTNIPDIVLVCIAMFLFTMLLSLDIYNSVKNLILNQQKIINKKTEELKQINRQLEQKIKEEVEKNRQKDRIMFQHSRMIAMGEMISNIAHQWRQPLNAISILIQGFAIKNMQGKLSDEYIEKQVAEGLRIANELSSTLDKFKNFFETNHKQSYTSLKNILKETIDFLQNEDINIQINSPDIKILCHKDDFSQVLLNLFSNSIDQFKKVKDPYNKTIIIKAKQIEDKVTITFIDNAGGIDEKIIDRIFEPYFTTKHKSQGTGIGLYMSKQIIEKQMNGRIWVENINLKIDKKTYKCAKFEINLKNCFKLFIAFL